MHLGPVGYSSQRSELPGISLVLNKSLGASSQFYFQLADQQRRFKAPEVSGAQFDRIKSLESLINELVLESNLAIGGDEAPTGALDKARQADEALESLRILMLQEQRSSSSLSQHSDTEFTESQPMTTGVNYFDLFVMVKSNLAAQLHNNDHLQQSLELYTQLCKLASNANSSPGISQLLGTSSGSQAGGSPGQQLQHGSRYMLYRFGLNIGNVLYDLAEYQKSLKYYRLTLDRLSTSGNNNLRIKLMNNIAITLATLNMAARQEDSSKRPATTVAGDTLTAFDLLLADNMTAQSKQQQQHLAANTMAKAQEAPQTRGDLCEVYNANHHQFALNLMVCHYLRSDFRAMLLVFKNLVQVNLSSQFKRVIDVEQMAKVHSVADQKPSDSASCSHASTAMTDSGPLVGARRASQQHLFEPPDLSSNKRPLVADSLSRPSTASFSGFDDDCRADSATSWSSSSVKTVKSVKRVQQQQQQHHKSNKQPTRLVEAIKEDPLEQVIRSKEEELSRCLLMCCKLMNSLDGSAIQAHCLRYLSSSEWHRHLVGELKFDCLASHLLAGGAGGAGSSDKLASSIRLVEELESEQENRLEQQQQVVGPAQSASVKRANLLSARRRRATSPLADGNGSKSNLSPVNQSLLYILRNKVDQARSLLEVSSGGKTAPDRTGRLVNLAYCYDRLDNLNESLRCLEEALRGDPSNWLVGYNLMQVNRKLGNHLNELPKQMNNSNLARPKLVRLLANGLLLEPIQLALLMHQSGMSQASWQLFGELLSWNTSASGAGGGGGGGGAGAGQAASSKSFASPELYLMLSKLEFNETRDDPMGLLRQANARHAYHVPVAERLVALLISGFHYSEARKSLLDCIRSQAGQVRWYQMLAECYRREANYKRAIEVYRLAVDLFPLEAAGCLRSLCKLARDLGLSEEAKEYEAKLSKLSRG